MASTASGRGRPAILSKTDLDLGNGNGNAQLRLVGDGDIVQIELPLSWSLDSLQRSATKTGGRTKVTFTLDTNGVAAPVEVPAASTNGNGSAPAAEKPAAKARATKKVAASTEGDKPKTTRKRAASPVSVTV